MTSRWLNLICNRSAFPTELELVQIAIIYIFLLYSGKLKTPSLRHIQMLQNNIPELTIQM